MVARYSENMPWKNPTSLPPSGGAVVLLTGSTGNIGSHILASLLADPRISRVYAFNRGQESAHRQAVAFRARGLPADLLFSDKYVPLVGDLNEERFGLSHDVYDEASRQLRSNVCALKLTGE